MSQPKHQTHMDTPDWVEHFSLAVTTRGHWKPLGGQSLFKKHEQIHDSRFKQEKQQLTRNKCTSKKLE